MTPEQSYLTGLVREAFNHIEWYDTIGYKSGFFSGEMMAEDVGREAGERNYRLFRASEFCKIADDALSYYVLSSQFKNDLRQDYFREEREEGKPIPDLPLDGSVEIRLDSVGKVRNYLIEVSRLGGLFEYNEPFREWFSRQFLHTLNDRNEYVRGSFERMLRQSTGRMVSFEDALGYTLGDFSDNLNFTPGSSAVIKMTQDTLDQMLIRKDDIKDRTSYDAVVAAIQESPLYATLFSNPIVLFSAYQAMVHQPGSIHSLRLNYFLDLVKANGVINSFEFFVPYPALDLRTPLDHIIPKMIPLPFTESLYTTLHCASMKESFFLQPLPFPREPDQFFSNKSMENRAWLEQRGARRTIRWTDEEKKLFSRKAINHLFNDPKAYSLFEQGGLYPDFWPAIVEELAAAKNQVLELLVDEIKSNSPLRKGTALGKPFDVYTSGEFARTMTINNAVYKIEVERSLVGVINALCDREMKISSDSANAVARSLANLYNQFMSVSLLEGTNQMHLSTIWMQRHADTPTRLCYYDEMDVETGGHHELAPIRDTLRKCVDEFAQEGGFTQVVFDPDEIIQE